MTELPDKIGYIRGLVNGLNVDVNVSPEGRVLGAILDALSSISEEIVSLRAAQEELDAYVESVDDDLAGLEEILEAVTDDDDDDDDDDDEDDDEDEDEDEDDDSVEDGDKIHALLDAISFRHDGYIDCVCPVCAKAYLIKDEDIAQHNHFICPHCDAVEEPVLIAHGVVPLACPKTE